MVSLSKIKEKLKQQKSDEPSDDFVEMKEDNSGEQKVSVRIEQLQGVADADRIQQFVREGHVVFLRIRELRTKDIAELKRAVERLKKTIEASNGDIVGVDEDFIILTPNFAKVYR